MKFAVCRTGIAVFIGLIVVVIGACTLDSRDSASVNPTFLSEIGQTLPGYQITFASPRKRNNQDIWVVNVDGTGERNLTGSLSGGYDIYPEWAPNGQYIYYTSNKHGGALEIYRVNTVGEAKPEQVSNFGKEVRSLSVSPENKYIALGLMSANVPLGASLKPYSADLYLLDQKVMNDVLASQKLVTLDDLQLILSEPAANHIWHEQPDWEPAVADTQSRIAYVRTQNYDDDPIMIDEIWTVNSDGSNNRRLIESSSMPRWTADGRSIATHEFSLFDIFSGQAKKLHVDNLARDAGAVSLSPDQKYILFETDDRERKAGLARVVFKGVQSQTAENPYSLLVQRPAYEPRWSPVAIPVLP